VVSEAGELALDAAVSPAGVLPYQADNELTEFAVDARAAGSVRVGPFSGDQASVPGQECGGGDEAVVAQLVGEEAGQGGQECPVGPGWAGWAELAARSTVTSCRSVSISAISTLLRRLSSASQDSIRVKVR
jgi:hypothetical protein